jgi:hypothetical protein
MASKRKIKPGDIVIYVDSGEIVTDEVGKVLRVVCIVERHNEKAVLYSNGEFDFYNTVEKCPPVLEELS